MRADSGLDKVIDAWPRIVWKLEILVLLYELPPLFPELTATLNPCYLAVFKVNFHVRIWPQVIRGSGNNTTNIRLWQNYSEWITGQMSRNNRVFEGTTMVKMSKKELCLIVGIIPIHDLPIFGKPRIA